MSDTTQIDKPDIVGKLKGAGRLKPADLTAISRLSEERGISQDRALLELDLVPEQEIAYFLCETYDLAFARLDRIEPPAKPVKLIGLERMERDLFVPLDHDGDTLTVACVDPSRLPDLKPYGDYFQSAVKLVVSPASDVKSALGRLKTQQETQAPMHPLEPSGTAATRVAAAPASDADLMRALGRVLLEASRGNVSDIHVAQGMEGLAVRFRRDGVLEARTVTMPPNDQARLVDLIKRLAGMDPKERRLPRIGKMRLPVAGGDDRRDLSLRVACAPTLTGERLTLRVLEAPDGCAGLEELGFGAENLRRLRGVLRKPAGGLVLFAGPARSGRSTTMAAALVEVPAEDRAVFSIEDPAERKLAGVTQMQADAACPISALVAAAREQDGDVLMICSIDDPEALRQAVEAAFGGSLVLAAVTAPDAVSALKLCLERGAEPYLLGSALRCVAAQRLVRKLCGQCRRRVYRMPEDVVQLKERHGLTGSTLYEPAGCEACGYRGFAGRIGAQEVLIPSAEFAKALKAGNPDAALANHRSLAHDAFAKALEGMTTVVEVERVLG